MSYMYINEQPFSNFAIATGTTVLTSGARANKGTVYPATWRYRKMDDGRVYMYGRTDSIPLPKESRWYGWAYDTIHIYLPITLVDDYFVQVSCGRAGGIYATTIGGTGSTSLYVYNGTPLTDSEHAHFDIWIEGMCK